MLPSGKGGHQHDEGAFGQMEVGDKAVDAVELDARVQENGGIAAAGADLAILCGNGFQRAAFGVSLSSGIAAPCK